MTIQRPRRAFTLVELLVVVAIIALLLGILLPALGKARKVAEAAACMAHLRGAGLGLGTYLVEGRNYLAGPNTSGKQLQIQGNSYTFSGSKTEPVQGYDWMSPTLGHSMALPDDRVERLVALFNAKLRCPSNKQKFQTQFTGPSVGVDPTTINVPSYLSPWWFHLAHPSNKPFPKAAYSYTSDLEVPQSFRANLSDIGSPSAKVYALDGTRYVNRNSSTGVVNDVNFNANVTMSPASTSFLGNGPVLSSFNGSPYYTVGGELTDGSRTYAYRHGDGVNAVFFDGHAENLHEPDSRSVGLYVPRGTLIKDAASTDDPNDKNQQIVD